MISGEISYFSLCNHLNLVQCWSFNYFNLNLLLALISYIYVNLGLDLFLIIFKEYWIIYLIILIFMHNAQIVIKRIWKCRTLEANWCKIIKNLLNYLKKIHYLWGLSISTFLWLITLFCRTSSIYPSWANGSWKWLFYLMF